MDLFFYLVTDFLLLFTIIQHAAIR